MKIEVQRTRRLLDDFFKIDEVFLRFEKFDGTMSGPIRRLVLDRGDAVAAIIRNRATGRLVFARQLRYPTHANGPGWLTEIIAGLVDAGEQPEAAIRREIAEESGYDVATIEHISTFYTTPGGSNERVFLYHAEVDGSRKTQFASASDEEDIELRELDLDAALRAVTAGDIVDAKTILALYWLKSRAP